MDKHRVDPQSAGTPQTVRMYRSVRTLTIMGLQNMHHTDLRQPPPNCINKPSALKRVCSYSSNKQLFPFHK